MNEISIHQLKQNVIAYCKRNGKINEREINSMMIPLSVIYELVKEKQLFEVKKGIYHIVKSFKVEQNKTLF